MNKYLFWFLQLTWGLLMNIIGTCAFLAMVVSGHKPKKFCRMVYFEVGNGWGGLNLGWTTLVSKNPSLHTLQHEFGHFSYQNTRFGLLMPFVVCIPSAIRYWYRELHFYKKGKMPTTVYDDIWFEGQSSKRGKEEYERLEGIKNATNKFSK